MTSAAIPTATSTAGPDRATLRRALESAVRAPSVYNSQPWRWHADTSAGVDLFADRDRHLITIDPDGHELLLSCGAALHHLVVALAGLGWSTHVDRFPDPDYAGHLAHVRPSDVGPPVELARLAAAIPLRRTDRRRFSAQPVDRSMLDVLVAHARAYGAELHVVADGTARTQMIETISRSATLQRQQDGYGAELARWTGRYAAAGDGIDSGTVASGTSSPRDVPMRPFMRGRLAQPAHSLEHEDTSTLMVLAGRSPDRLDTLRAGEAISAVLLAATELGLATTPLSQPLEVTRTRDWITQHIVGPDVFPQLVLRVGWADPDSPALPPTLRRNIDHVLRHNR